MGNKRNRRSSMVESQSSDREENTLKTSFTQGNWTLINVSEDVDNISDRNFGNELTELSEVSKGINVLSQRLTEQNNTKMSQFEEQLILKIEEVLGEVRPNNNNNLTSGKVDAVNSRTGSVLTPF